MAKVKKPKRIDWLKQVLCDDLGCAYVHSEGVFGHNFEYQQQGLHIDIYAPKQKGGDWLLRDYSASHVCDDHGRLPDRSLRDDDKATRLLKTRIHSRERAVEVEASLNPDVRDIMRRLLGRVERLEQAFQDMREEQQDYDY